jgi:hypothetical protein
MADRDLLIVSVLTMALVPMAMGLTVAYERVNCSGYQTVTGRATRYEGFQCYVNDGTVWHTMDEYRFRNPMRGGENSLPRSSDTAAH